MRLSFRLPRKRDCFLLSGAFSLPEVLICTAVVAIILLAMTQFIGSIAQASKAARNDPYADVEDAFEKVASHLENATLESYQDYADKSGAFRTDPVKPFIPDHVALRSDLDFVCGTQLLPSGLMANSGRITAGTGLFFVAPQGYTRSLENTGMERLLNASGYFVEFGSSDSAPSFVMSSPVWRWRLKEIAQPSEDLQVYAAQSPLAWIQQEIQTGAPTTVMADNVFLFLALPERAATDSGTPLAPAYAYDSRDASNLATYNQLPIRVRLVMGAIDSSSADVLAARSGASVPSLIGAGLFSDSTRLDGDLATLDASLTAQKIGHRFFQRTVQLPSIELALVPSP